MEKTELNNALIQAVENGDAAKTKELLDQKADPNTVIDRMEKTVLMLAAEKGRLEIVRLLTEKGADINRRDKKEKQTALFPALWEGYRDVAAYLIEKGADVLTPKVGGRTTLMYAAHSNSAELVHILLDKGVKINAENELGLSALMYTDEDDNKLDAMRILLKRGADINHKNSIGQTSVMRAVNLGSLKAAEILLEQKADTSTISQEGFNIMELAEGAEQNSSEMVELLHRFLGG